MKRIGFVAAVLTTVAFLALSPGIARAAYMVNFSATTSSYWTNVRSGPGTDYGVIRQTSPHSTVDFDRVVLGQGIDPRTGELDYRWYGIAGTDGTQWISGAILYGDAPGTMLTYLPVDNNPLPPSSQAIEQAIGWAQSQQLVNPRGIGYQGMCLKFADDAYSAMGYDVRRYSSAQTAGSNLIASTYGDPPRGAYVFYSWREDGHVGISLGNGEVIQSLGSAGTFTTSVYGNGLAYRGWGWPQG